MNYTQWLDQWLNNYIHPSAKLRTFSKYSDIVRTRIAPTLGTMDTNALTPLVLQKFVTELLQNGNMRTGDGLSANTVNSTISIVQNSLRVAHEIGVTADYVGDKIKRPRQCEKQIESFTHSEQYKIERFVFQQHRINRFGILISLYTGLRIGELLALTWDDVNFSRNLLSVNKSCYDGKNEQGRYVRIVSSPKTEMSCRTIPLPKPIVKILRKMKAKSVSNYVIEAKGKPILVRVYQKMFADMLHRLEIPHRGFHALRHTFATRAIECGIDIKTLSEIMGHKNPSVTLKRYVHSLMDHKRAMMKKVGKLLWPHS